ncbi:hypothetical protein BKA70DRAFT_1538553 [Coprinopsis sp. MPI-PUGE-AT-0042]|nr:hypothetical protein BKA70DRAFT_1538553 [Coprinopsis sp. MPI-PUGE-AT-0042]
MPFVRTLKFISDNLGKNATLLLTFDDIESNRGMHSEYHPTAFKVIGFSANGMQSVSVTYKNQLVFLKPQVDQSNIIVSSGVFKSVEVDQQTDLITTQAFAPKMYEFTPPVPGSAGDITAYNKTGEEATIAIGFQDPRNPTSATPSLVFKDVPNTNSVKAKFHPVLRGYFTSDHQENEVLTSEVGSPEAFKQSLEQLPEESTWLITKEGDGKLTIKRG